MACNNCGSTTTITTSTTTSCASCGCQIGGQQVSWDNVLYKPDYLESDNIPQFARVEISSAEILSLFSSPKELLPTPGTGKCINLISAYSFFTAGGTPYTNANVVNLRYTSQPSSIFTLSSTHITGISKTAKFFPVQSDTNVITNGGIQLFVPNANPTAGTGTMVVYLYYNTFIVS